jgi:predicted transcriptional regulator
MLFMEIMAVYSENRTKSIVGKIQLLNVKAGGTHNYHCSLKDKQGTAEISFLNYTVSFSRAQTQAKTSDAVSKSRRSITQKFASRLR